MRSRTTHPSDRQQRRSFPFPVPLIVFALLASAPVSAAELVVPDDYATIQAAIDAAVDGDSVRIEPGIYFEHISFLGKAIRVFGAAGAEATTIDGELSDIVVRFENGEDELSILEGLTIAHGGFDWLGSSPIDGAGIVCVSSSPTIRANIVEECQTPWRGAGIYSLSGSPHIVDNVIRNNSFFCIVADYPCGNGGGLYLSGGSPVVDGNLIAGNTAFGWGGGLALDGAVDATITNNQFIGNSACHGGAIYAHSGQAQIINNVFESNQAVGYYTLTGPVDGHGGALAFDDGFVATIEYGTLTNNDAGGGGGGGLGGALAVFSDTIAVRNSILWGNTADGDAQIHTPVVGFTVSYCDVEGSYDGFGNLDADPLLIGGPLGDHYLSNLAAGEAATSPCVDAGDGGSGIIVDGTTRTDHEPDVAAPDLGFHYLGGLPPSAFTRGDVNDDGLVDISDAIFALAALFVSGATQSACDDASDANDDGTFDLSDAISILASLFTPGAPPLPEPSSCALDPTADALDCEFFDTCL